MAPPRAPSSPSVPAEASATTSASSTSSPAIAAPTAALIIIGDELLRGKFVDENGPFLLRRLRELGVDVLRVEIIPDDVEIIAESVARWSPRVDHLITTGGVGPTHDDLTMEGVSRGLGRRLVRDPRLEALLSARMGERYNEAAARMAEVPEGAELREGGGMSFPQVRAGNVWIFPGVPSLLRRKFDGIAGQLGGRPMGSRRLVTTEHEPQIADALTAAAAAHPTVSIGSYPQFDRQPWTVTITLDSRDEPALLACEARLRAALGAGLIEAPSSK
jgi:molybdenum cofactor synthesis domain-containing protein